MILWHNPRCAKSRQALVLLRDNGVEPTLRLYLKDPPTEAEIEEVRDALAVPPMAMMRRGEALFNDLGLADADDAALVAAMAANPILMERPIAISATGARIGRPPEQVLVLLGDGGE
ncbi:arsenate reductase (glutaredoxin) [Salibaculum halophilum]|uniref:arsenate reductase (glutaredoxin) n=1 Tax=Salibaculum halophilum TaxID=1914408 RepID=UPI000A10A10C|nr:arsenate reductase (glutaredoxin) [Salibaculum halophilum]